MEAELAVETRPRILLLRPPGSSAEALMEAGVVAHIPVIDIEPVPETIEEMRRLLPDCDWLVVTSPRAVKIMAPILDLIDRLRREKRLRIAAVGPKTRWSLQEAGLDADLVPREYRGAALAVELASQGPRCVLLARSEKAVPELPRILEAEGVRVVEKPLYRVVELDDMAEAAASIADRFDYVVFTSPSIARAFTRHYSRPDKPGFAPVAIGPTTAAELRRLGYPEPLTPSIYTLEGIAELIARHWSGGAQAAGRSSV